MKKLSPLFLILTLFVLLFSQEAESQGCIAIRSTGGVCNMDHNQMADTTSKWEFNLNNRYFKSFRHFIGTAQQKQRVEQGTDVINHQYTADLTLSRHLNKRWLISLDAPILANSRSDLYEHHNVGRFVTHSFGLGDIRLTAYRWMVDPDKMSRFNLQLGLGIKFATGDYDYQDFFHTSDSTEALGPVDQSIQLGDGGTGITVEANSYYYFTEKLSLYSNFYYLLNPRDQNGTSTSREQPPSASSILYHSSTMSVPDQYLIRLMVNYSVGKFLLSAGVRDECLPVHDLIGGSDGFRRPGFIISAEPGITYNLKKTSFYASVPVAIVRDRTQSVPDKIKTELTGVYSHGDAAFADYVINVGLTTRF